MASSIEVYSPFFYLPWIVCDKQYRPTDIKAIKPIKTHMVPVRAIVAVVLSAIICIAVESIKNALALWEPTGGGRALWRKKISRVFYGARAFHRSKFYGAKLKSDPLGLLADTIVGELTGKAETHPHKQRTARNREDNACNTHKVIGKARECSRNCINHLSVL